MILILSDPTDLHVQAVLPHLDRQNRKYHFLSFSDFPHAAFGSFNIENESLVSLICNKQYSYSLDLNHIQSVWYRYPQVSIPHQTTDPVFHEYIIKESMAFIRSLEFFMPNAFWVSSYDAMVIADRKPYQLLVAKSLGFQIPKTYIGNDVEQLKKFLKKLDSVIVKPLCSRALEADLTFKQKVIRFFMKGFLKNSSEKPGTAHLDPYLDYKNVFTIDTQLLSSQELLSDIERLQYCPVIFQEPIPKKRELRITVVGGNIFTCAMRHKADMPLEGKIDFKKGYDFLEYEPYSLPPAVESKIKALMKKLNLAFGTIDMILTPDDNLFFLEINTTGQWLWIEQETGLPISSAMTDLLTSVTK